MCLFITFLFIFSAFGSSAVFDGQATTSTAPQPEPEPASSQTEATEIESRTQKLELPPTPAPSVSSTTMDVEPSHVAIRAALTSTPERNTAATDRVTPRRFAKKTISRPFLAAFAEQGRVFNSLKNF